MSIDTLMHSACLLPFQQKEKYSTMYLIRV